jgi:hypothetical protein
MASKWGQLEGVVNFLIFGPAHAVNCGSYPGFESHKRGIIEGGVAYIHLIGYTVGMAWPHARWRRGWWVGRTSIIGSRSFSVAFLEYRDLDREPALNFNALDRKWFNPMKWKALAFVGMC